MTADEVGIDDERAARGGRSGGRYVVLGCGRQGTAAALDLARFGGAAQLVLADADPGRAARLEERLGSWLGGGGPEMTTVSSDAGDAAEIRRVLRGADAAVFAVPYRFLLEASRAAVDAAVHACDLGGHPETVRAQLELDSSARESGVALVPDCGQAPGMATTLTTLAVDMVEEPETVELWDGGLPVDPEPPLRYRLTFDVRGLTNEYDGPCWALRDGEPVAFESLEGRHTVRFPEPLGELDAFYASGTGSTLPWSLRGRIREFTSRIVRYPGHLDRMRTLKELGLFGLDPVEVEGTEVVPRRVTEAVLEPRLVGEGPIADVVVVRVHCAGRDGGRPVRAEVDLMTFHDPETGLTAMQRCTGFDAAIVAAMAARGEIEPGVSVRERSVDPERYVEELARRGIEVERRRVPLE